MCSIDWQIMKDILVAIIGAGIPSIVAIIIYRGWSGQKEREVIALEAKNILVNMDKFELIQKDMLFWLGLDSGKISEISLQEFSILKDSTENSILLLKHAINDKEFKIYLDEVITKLENFERTIHGYSREFINLKDINTFSFSGYNQLKIELLEYALYKKEVNKK